VNDFRFAEASTPVLPRHSRSTYVIAALVHLALIAVLIHVKTQPPRVGAAGSPFGSMTAYVTGAAAASAPAAAATPKPAEPKRNALTTNVTKAVPQEDAGAAAGVAAGVAGGTGAGQAGAGSGPVRIGSGGQLTLIKRVQPIYPTLMQSARMTGQVVLDAIIHPDGTIGDITVLRSTNDAFAQSAIAAVKQWRYSAPGFEGILTVSVNFTLNT
jgi:TonB family protein